MMRLLFAVSCLWCWAASVQAQTLLVLGDSLSAGYQMKAEQSWPALLNENGSSRAASTNSSTPASAVRPLKVGWPPARPARGAQAGLAADRARRQRWPARLRPRHYPANLANMVALARPARRRRC